MKHLILTAVMGITLVLLITSCGKNPHQQKIVQIDSLMIELENVGNILQATDTASMHATFMKQIENINFIQKNVDSISRETAYMIDEYSKFKKAYSKWYDKIPAFYSELNLRKEQLVNLKNDLEKELIDETKAGMYYSTEALHVKTLKAVVEQMDSSLKGVSNDFPAIESRIDELMHKLKGDSAI